MRYNRRKLAVLKLLAEQDDLSAWEVANSLNMGKNAASKALDRYYRQGLLRRTRKYGGRYQLTRKGVNRLLFLRSEM